MTTLVIFSCSGGGGGGGGSESAAPAEPVANNTAAPQVSFDSVEQVSADLNGLDIDSFIEGASRALLVRSPESVVSGGLGNYAGDPPVVLDDVSDEFVSETYDLMAAILVLLRDYDRSQMSDIQQSSYDVYEWYLEDQLNQAIYQLHTYPANFSYTSLLGQTEFFFNELHPIGSREDAEDYLTRLGFVDDRIDQIIVKLRDRESFGVVEPALSLAMSIDRLVDVMNGGSLNSTYYLSLEEGLIQLSLDQAATQSLLENASSIISAQVLPAYERLHGELGRLEAIAPTGIGVGQYENGLNFYQQSLRHHTTTELSAVQIHELGLDELERIHGEIRTVASGLGYAADLSLNQLFSQVASDGGYVPAHRVVDTYAEIIENANAGLASAFSRVPDEQVQIIGGSEGGFYVSGSYDGARAGAFYVSDVYDVARFRMSSLAYHETLPGHHLQIALSHELGLPPFRRDLHFSAYIEGWALYAERLAFELGWYDNDGYGDLGRLQYEALRAARLVVDTGIHDLGWSFDQAATYFAGATGFSMDTANSNIVRYMLNPGQATAYMVGMKEILELRNIARARLGVNFDLREFHEQVLNEGSLPLSLLSEKIERWLVPG